MEKAIIVSASSTGKEMGELTVLNQHLESGWKVKSSTPMGGGGETSMFTILVIIEKSDFE